MRFKQSRIRKRIVPCGSSWRRPVSARLNGPSSQVVPLLLHLGFARDVVLRVAHARTHSHRKHLCQLTKEDGRRSSRKKAETWPHVAKEACEKLEELGWDTVPNPTCFLDIAFSEHHLFRLLKAFQAKKKSPKKGI